MINPREEVIQTLQRFLRRRYNKQIVEARDPFEDMPRLLGRDDVRGIVDGGAYHGEIGLKLAAIFPRATVYAFEPASEAFGILASTAQVHRRLVPVNLALSSAAGRKTLYINAQTSANALSPVGEGGRRYQTGQTRHVGSEKVTLVTLDGWARRTGNPPIDLIKLDLQGHELRALKGARSVLRRAVRLVYTEVEFVRIYRENCLFSDVEIYLRELGFELYQLYNITVGDDGQIVCADAIFIARKEGG